MSQFQQPPIGAPIADGQDGVLGSAWSPWFLTVQQFNTNTSTSINGLTTTTGSLQSQITSVNTNFNNYVSSNDTRLTNDEATIASHTTSIATFTTYKTNAPWTSAQYHALTDSTTSDASDYHTHRTFPAGTAGTPPTKFTTGTLTTSATAGALEYDGSKFYVTNSTPTRMRVTTGYIATAFLTVLAGGLDASHSPFVYTQTGPYNAQIIVGSTGTSITMSISKNGSPYLVLPGSYGIFTIAPGDKFKIDFFTSPVVTYMDL